MVRNPAHIVLLFGTIGYLSLMFVWLLVPAFLGPISDELLLSNTQAGMLTGAVSFVYIPFALGSGILIDRIGAPRAIGYGIALFGAAQVFRSMATEFWTILLLTVIIGIGGTAITFGLPKLVSTLYPPNQSGTMSSVYLVGMYAGTAAAFAVGRPVLGPILGGWRPVFFWSGITALGICGFWFLIWRWLGTRTSSWTVSENGTSPNTSHRSARKDILQLVRNRGILLLTVIGFAYLMAVHGLQNWLTVILQEWGVTTQIAVWTTSLFVVAQLIGTLVLPPLSDYRITRRSTLLSCGASVSIGTFALLLVNDHPILIAFSVVIAGFGLGGVATLVRSLPIEMKGIGPQLMATAVGLVFMVGELGGFLGPLIIGALADQTGSFAVSILILGVGTLLILGASIFLTHAD